LTVLQVSICLCKGVLDANNGGDTVLEIVSLLVLLVHKSIHCVQGCKRVDRCGLICDECDWISFSSENGISSNVRNIQDVAVCSFGDRLNGESEAVIQFDRISISRKTDGCWSDGGVVHERNVQFVGLGLIGLIESQLSIGQHSGFSYSIIKNDCIVHPNCQHIALDGLNVCTVGRRNSGLICGVLLL